MVKRNKIIDDRWQKIEIEKANFDDIYLLSSSVNPGPQPTAILETSHENFETDIIGMFAQDFSNRVSSSNSDLIKDKTKGGVIYG